jgi:ketosteroid isomerase-like protein
MSSNSSETEAVVTNHLGAFFKASIDGVVQDYAADSVLIVRDGPLRGMQDIRGFFREFIGTLPVGFLEAFKMHRQEFVGDVGYIVWEALPWVSLGTDTFVVRSGKIVMQTFACYPLSW